MASSTTMFVFGFAVAWLCGVALGIAASRWWLRRVNARQRSMQKPWPIAYRRTLNSREQTVWNWLRESFPDHHVVIKLPVIRFTASLNTKSDHPWFKELRNVYCTFSVCTHDGHIVGCVDVPAFEGMSTRNQTFKRSLLSQLKSDIGYLIRSIFRMRGRCDLPSWGV